MAGRKLKIAISPCPNDTFIVSGIYLGKVISEGFKLDFFFEDVETLNRWAIESRFEIIKTSFGVWGKIYKNYELLPVGSALGFGVGPLLVGKKFFTLSEFSELKVAIPGEHTTAHHLFNFFYKGKIEKIFMKYDEIIPFLLKDRCEMGILIHEGRFVYEKYHLKKIVDLGEYWERKTGAPVPLGGYFVKRNLPFEIKKEVIFLLRKSLEWAEKNWEEVYPFLKTYARELEEEIIKKHVNTFVNKYTFGFSEEALKALETFARLTGINESIKNLIFEG